jgi:hypothetical protein
MGQKDIGISLIERELHLGPTEVAVKRGDSIRWTSSHPFALHFGKRSPFQPANRNDGKGGAVAIQSCDNSAERTVAQDAPLGSYKYVVAVCGDDVEICNSPSLRVEC